MSESVIEQAGVKPDARRAMLKQWIAFLVIAMGVLGGLHVYLGWRLFNGLSLRGPVATAGWVLIGALFCSMPLGFATAHGKVSSLTQVFYWVGHLWMGAFWILLSWVAAADGIRLIAGAVFWRNDLAALRAWDRVEAGGILGMLPVVLLYAFFVAQGPAKVEHIEVPIEGLPPEWEGFRIVQISDLHVGRTLGRRFVARVVDQVNRLTPDLVAITGDLVDGTVEEIQGEVEPLATLAAKEGSYFVTGNHEYYSGADEWEAAIGRLGITVLHNAHRVLRRGGSTLVIAGVTDLQGRSFGARHQPDFDAALAKAPQDAVRVLLSHQPSSAAYVAPHRVDLQLSGHTHGGQIFPFGLLVRLQQPVLQGLRRLAGHWVYTSRGTGYWGPPLRLLARPEISELTLRRTNASSAALSKAAIIGSAEARPVPANE